MTKPSDMPHRALTAVRNDMTAIDTAISEVNYVLGHWLRAGYDPDTATHLTQITLDQILD